jgi:hypothetical protein
MDGSMRDASPELASLPEDKVPEELAVPEPADSAGIGYIRLTLEDQPPAGVAELVDALDLGSSDASRGGSSPSARTTTGLDTARFGTARFGFVRLGGCGPGT